MPPINHIPALLRVAVVFVLILLLIRKRISLENAFFLGAILLSLFFQMSPLATAKSMTAAICYPKTLSLSVIVGLILILSRLMELSGQMQRMLKNFGGLLKSPRLNLIVFPAIIGLLPMPGGAVFSAPMVKELGGSLNLSGDKLSFINYWFRHIWEYWWPLYPGVLLATIMADISLPLFILLMCPLTLCAVSLGYMKLKNAGIGTACERHERDAAWAPFLKELAPILIVIIPGLGMGALFSMLMPGITIGKELGLVIALLFAIGWVWFINKITFAQMQKEVINRRLLQMILLIFAILVFKGVLEDSHAVDAISAELFILKIPLVVIAILLPFLIGVITGITIAFVGSTFPILIPLIHSIGHGELMLPYVLLAMTCGFMGVVLSPLHLCFILSNQYFTVDMKKVYRHLWLPCGGVAALSILYFSVLVHVM